MKKLSTILLAVILAGLTAVNAQAPRVRSSAPVEKTAQKGAPAPKVKSAGKSGAKGTGVASSAGVQKGTKKGAKKANQKAVESLNQESGLYMAVKTNIAYDAFAPRNVEPLGLERKPRRTHSRYPARC